MSWPDAVLSGDGIYDADCDAKVVIGRADMERIWTPDVYIYNAIDTVSFGRQGGVSISLYA